MMNLQAIVALMGFCFVSSITPGPNNLMLLTSGARFGFARTLPHLIGVSGGFTLMILLVGAGIKAIFDLVPFFQEALRGLSLVYLVYLAWKIANAPCSFGNEAEDRGRPMSFLQAALFQWVNPKAWAMAVTALTIYAPSRNPDLALLVTAAVFGAINLPCVGLWAAVGTRLRVILSSPRRHRLFNLGAAILLVATLYPLLFP